MYHHPAIPMPVPLAKDTIVEHMFLKGVPLVVVAGPTKTPRGDQYKVRRPDGKEEPVLRKNLIL
jgi:hypothetical protein